MYAAKDAWEHDEGSCAALLAHAKQACYTTRQGTGER
jgi:hypothetical protein